MWYRRNNETEKGEITDKGRMGNRWKRKKEMREQPERKQVEIKAVIFVQQTKNSKLVKKLRETEEK